MNGSTGTSVARDGFVQTNGHGRMHYLEAGSGDPLLLIHTNGGSAHQYAGVMARLARSFRVIAWDMPGHGDSDPVTRHYSIADYCAALAAFMDSLCIPAAHVSGCSCGGTITLGFAASHASRTLSAVVVETPFRTFDEWGARWTHTEANFCVPTQGIEEVRHRLARVDDAVLARWNIDRNKAGGKLMIDVMWAMREFDAAAALAAITRPTMVLYGAKGPTIAMRDRATAAAPCVPIESLPGSGHFPMLDEPDAFADTLARFCGGAPR
jgi:3-oxoadipate enol-lactonase